MADATSTAIQTGLAASYTKVEIWILSPFEGEGTDYFWTFRVHVSSFLALASVPEALNLDYLQLPLSGGALAD